MSVLVFIETKDGKLTKAAFEAVSYGSKIGATTVVTYGNADAATLAELGNYGATKVLVNRDVEGNNEQQLTKLVVAAASEVGADTVVLIQDQIGKAVGPRVAARLAAGHASGAIAVPETGAGFIVKTNVFSGKAYANVAIHTDKKVISLISNAVPPVATGGSAEVVDFSADLGVAGIKVKEVKGQGEGVPLPEAELVVSAGRGLKGPENWGMVEDLATTLGAATACSRPVADIGWRPHHEHVGQTGVAIRPNLYIAAGISGAIQHLAGVNSSKVIVVVNTDAEAPFFKAADYGIVGDAFEVLPKLNDAVKKFKASQN
jgi:electron transfer flavoprotein alpha subunit